MNPGAALFGRQNNSSRKQTITKKLPQHLQKAQKETNRHMFLLNNCDEVSHSEIELMKTNWRTSDKEHCKALAKSQKEDTSENISNVSFEVDTLTYQDFEKMLTTL